MSVDSWSTVRPERTVLAVVHNTTAATRLFDILPLFAEDPRVETVFTCPGSSAFTAGTDEFLARAGITRLLPWRQALRHRPDFAIAASYGGDLHEISAPLMVVPHGMGYNKYLESNGISGVFGLSSPWLLHRGRPVPSVIVLSHAEQLTRLAEACPEAVGAALVAGDPCFDRMLASRPLRESYRQALGVRPHQRLVLVSSTWGAASLYGSDPGLIARLAAQLDLDSYRLAVALHPNIAGRHSRWQVDRWLEDCVRAGVLVLPTEQLWGPALVAADVTIGDHGSVSFYSAALGTPLLLAAAPADAVDPRSPVGRLLEVTPRLDRHAPPGPQLEHALSGPEPHGLAAITELTTSLPGKSAAVLRETIYRWLDLPPPRWAAETRALPVPEVTVPHAHAQLVRVRLHDGEATVDRFPADALREPDLLPPDAHLVVDTREASVRLLDLADVLVHDGPPDPAQWVERTLGALPGCRLAAARTGGTSWLLGTADGMFIELDDVSGPVAAFAALLLHRPPGRLQVVAGGRRYSAVATVVSRVRSAGLPSSRRET
ncbi:hypothetical protein FHX82_000285 [Amycolatopsis bartoniae]|uniref:Uncharacterized protein n=1 Tax=Amycolatopsis bartoniae TaxID=941986 RepID=A0A8H9ISN2_9PSEU|nr:hypothetical protein [Amycolatopsis bartoniae]MBB2933265.1 hypothetical protein [Amycolatopsis bartoniae]TVS99346.1 hypothetical protein FNH07_35220 [Amycolatopsis bartoniae]GHF58262.1 hypothetical protein GCM10017566_34490 [Amycolatopsis bartoniae]